MRVFVWDFDGSAAVFIGKIIANPLDGTVLGDNYIHEHLDGRLTVRTVFRLDEYGVVEQRGTRSLSQSHRMFILPDDADPIEDRYRLKVNYIPLGVVPRPKPQRKYRSYHGSRR